MSKKSLRISTWILCLILSLPFSPLSVLAEEKGTVSTTTQQSAEEDLLYANDTATEFSIFVVQSQFTLPYEYQVYIHAYNGTDYIKGVYASIGVYTNFSGTALYSTYYANSSLTASHNQNIYVGTFQSNTMYTTLYVSASSISIYKLGSGMEYLSNYSNTLNVN